MSAFEFAASRRNEPRPADRLIAVVSDTTSEETIRSLILDHVITHARVVRGSIDDAIEMMKHTEQSPQHLIVDVSGSSMPVSDLARLAEACEPSVTVIVIGDRNDVGLFRSLLEIGVRDYLVKPLTAELVRRALHASDPHAAMRTGKAISFTGARGGVGVTTITTALARHLADGTRRRIVYVDLDLYGGGATSMLGMVTNNGLSELLQNPQRLDDQLISQAVLAQSDRLHVLSCELPYDSDFTLRAGAIAELVGLLKRHYHYVLLDVPAHSGRPALEALDASAVIHVVADRSVQAVHEATRLCRFADQRASEPLVTLLVNDAQAPVRARVKGEDFTRALARASVHQFPYEPDALALAENLGEPVPDNKRAGFAKAIVALANSLTGSETVTRLPWYARLTGKRRTA
ncbi:AAA family ATPase (plasmid) [Burkholderia humptydooensis]|uniref:AAA family ATPase n=2 Tax=Burkholderia humptydooensis TaxID=430531 RepID=A0A7U4P7X9_9BURK|nr:MULTISPECIES: AAA family ATPase [Burkholderia]AJY38082.1 response regulator [Burkholderia sp. 2002721687]ALX44579.1 fimbrial protein [Burkholderia humptydooensis]EIP85001.1 CpaE, putative [Burkholderia humptydooensis MSMB43]QPS42036.1 AAA family ATPase [Burkholderia humptydooensis]